MRSTGCILLIVYFVLNVMSRFLKQTNSSAYQQEAVLYARVSSKEQDKEGFSSPAQLKLLRDYARTEGLRVAQEYVDVEAAKQAGRTNFGSMISHTKVTASARVLLVEKTDRLCRNLKDWVTKDGELTAELRQPFDLLQKTVAAARTKKATELSLDGLNEIWLPGQDSNLRQGG